VFQRPYRINRLHYDCQAGGARYSAFRLAFPRNMQGLSHRACACSAGKWGLAWWELCHGWSLVLQCAQRHSNLKQPDKAPGRRRSLTFGVYRPPKTRAAASRRCSHDSDLLGSLPTRTCSAYAHGKPLFLARKLASIPSCKAVCRLRPSTSAQATLKRSRRLQQTTLRSEARDATCLAASRGHA
jgi:hypothetical protein